MYLQSQYSFKHPWSVQKKNISTFVGTCKIKQGIHIHSCSHIIRTCIHVRVYIYNYYLKALFCFIELCDIWRKKTPNINKALLWITHLSFHILPVAICILQMGYEPEWNQVTSSKSQSAVHIFQSVSTDFICYDFFILS